MDIRNNRETHSALSAYGFSSFICSANWPKADLWAVLRAYRQKSPVFGRQYLGKEWNSQSIREIDSRS